MSYACSLHVSRVREVVCLPGGSFDTNDVLACARHASRVLVIMVVAHGLLEIVIPFLEFNDKELSEC